MSKKRNIKITAYTAQGFQEVEDFIGTLSEGFVETIRSIDRDGVMGGIVVTMSGQFDRDIWVPFSPYRVICDTIQQNEKTVYNISVCCKHKTFSVVVFKFNERISPDFLLDIVSKE
jgi:hypothetical protein